MNLDLQSFLGMLIPSLRLVVRMSNGLFVGVYCNARRPRRGRGAGGLGVGVGALVFGDDLMTGGKKGRKKTEQVGHDGGK